jgi:hypothetical protein
MIERSRFIFESRGSNRHPLAAWTGSGIGGILTADMSNLVYGGAHITGPALPRRVIAEFATNDMLHIQVDVCGMPEEQLTMIAAKIGQSCSVVNAYWHRV